MRVIPTTCLKEGMISAKQVIGRNGELLLNNGTVLQNSYIEKLTEMGYPGIYIEDSLSEEINVNDVISQDLRNKTIKTLKNAYNSLESGKPLSKNVMGSIGKLVDNIVDEVLSCKDLMVNMIDLKLFDDYTFFHSVNVTVLSVVIGINLNLNRDDLYKLALAAMLHDIGKVFIPKSILNKPKKLNFNEFEKIKEHSYLGYKYLKENYDIPAASYIGVLQHHEKYDGSGYPNNKKGEHISVIGRILAIADIYDALTSDRPYRKSLTPSEAIEFIMGAGGTVLDPEMARCFIKSVAPYPVGICVSLSNNMQALVVENYQDCCTRPKIKIIRHGNKNISPYIIDLKNDTFTRDVTILGIIS